MRINVKRGDAVRLHAHWILYFHELMQTRSIRGAAKNLNVAVATGYDRAVCGTPETLADFMEEEFEATGCRGGFMISHPYSTPRDMMDIIDFLIPELQRRGRFRTQYEGRTLRDNLSAH